MIATVVFLVSGGRSERHLSRLPLMYSLPLVSYQQCLLPLAFPSSCPQMGASDGFDHPPAHANDAVAIVPSDDCSFGHLYACVETASDWRAYESL